MRPYVLVHGGGHGGWCYRFEQQLQLKNEAAMRKIPESHIVCTATLSGRNVAQLKASSNGRFWDIDTGHDLMITEPEAVAQMLLRAGNSS
jgi:hypothetical protein